MFPISDTAPRAASPSVVYALILVNTIVFLWMWSLPPHALEVVTVKYALIPLRYADPEGALAVGLDPDNWWPLLTSTFLHGGWLHLILNMWTLWIFGPAMEARYGRLGFALLYLCGGVAASATHLIANFESSTPVLGASGAIAAVLGAYAVIYPHARVLSIIPLGFLFIPLSLPALLFALIWFGLQVLQGTHDLFTPSFAGGVAWWAHIGGFLFGALTAMPVRAGRWVTLVHTTQWGTHNLPRRASLRGPWSRD
jgi:membrane associated rhomboid family serine protease